MKIHRVLLTAAFCAALCMAAGCGGDSSGGGLLPGSPSRTRYVLRLPALPPAWAALPGSPVWRIEWLDREGERRETIVTAGNSPEIDLNETWTSPVLAWPCWPDRDIQHGIFRPAGALFPFDVSGDTLSLSWRAGVDAVLYWELARAAAEDPGAAGLRAPAPRLPPNFNWPRFRELFTDAQSGLNADIRRDPWLADWARIAVKTVASGFDKRRLVPEERKPLSVPVGPGPWAGISPFAEPLYFTDPPAFPVRKAAGAEASADTWVSAAGLLRCNGSTWLFVPW